MKQILKFLAFVLLFHSISSCKKESKKPDAPIPVIIPEIGELIPVGYLSIPRNNFAVAAGGNKILVAGGVHYLNSEAVSTRVDIYDTITHKWSTAELSEGRMGLAAVTVENKILFAGGIKKIDLAHGTFETTSRVDIYDVLTNSWTISEMPKPGYFDYGGTAVAGNKAFLYSGDSTEIFVFDVISNSWSTLYLSEPRIVLAVASDQNQNIFFAGGLSISKRLDSKRVDVYNAISNSWSADSLSEARNSLKATSVNGKTIFAGGQTIIGSFSDKVDIYDNSVSAWTIANLKVYDTRTPISAAISSGEKAVFIDGHAHADIYDASQNSWSSVTLYRRGGNPDPPSISMAIVAGDKTYIIGALPDTYHGLWVTRF